MKRDTIIIGNGIGLTLSATHFNLSNALDSAWKSSSLSATEKALISQHCLYHLKHDYPVDEEEFYHLSNTCSCCSGLSKDEVTGIPFLKDDAKIFPEVIQKFKTAVAWNLFSYGGKLPDSFVLPLVSHVKSTNSHIATFNYDGLLYKCFYENGVFGDYDHAHLIDGFHCDSPKQFDGDHLKRKNSHDFGLYLHLHGSSLFYGEDDMPKKQSMARIDSSIICRHLILSDNLHKEEQIQKSLVLRTYWDVLGPCIDESEKVFIFGYKGLDSHLNNCISEHIEGKEVIVIEWDKTGPYTERQIFWNTSLFTRKKPIKFSLFHLSNILDFVDWEM